MIIPSELQFTAERLMKSQGRTGTADNDINAIVSMGMVPQGYRINNYLTDSDAFYILTDVPNGMKISMLRFILQKTVTELSKRKLCYQDSVTHK